MSGNLTGSMVRGRRETGAKVLVVEDDDGIRHLVRRALEREGFAVRCTETVEEGMDVIAHWHPDVVVADIMFPKGMDGLEMCRQVRDSFPESKVIVLSAKHLARDKVTSIEAGAYDHVEKPFDLDELIARVRVGLRTPPLHGGDQGAFRTGGLTLSVERREVSIDGVKIHLAGKQFEILKYLFRHIEKVVPHATLLEAVWGLAYASSVDELRVYIANLRQKIEVDPRRPRYLLTVHGVGYKLALLPS